MQNKNEIHRALQARADAPPSYRFVSCFSERPGKGAESYTRRFLHHTRNGVPVHPPPDFFPQPPNNTKPLDFLPAPAPLQPASVTGHRVGRFFPHAPSGVSPPRAGTQMMREAKHSTLGARCLWCSGQQGGHSRVQKKGSQATTRRASAGRRAWTGRGMQNTYKKRAGVWGSGF